MHTPIRLIVGIGNPGSKYALTRHNVGQRWVESLAETYGVQLSLTSKHRGYLGRGLVLGNDVRLLLPTTYVNASGESVGMVCRYFNIPSEEVLVVHDDVAFPPGTSRLKFGGGANGHNGLSDVIRHFAGSREFGRLRIGVGHPGVQEKVVRYLVSVPMSQQEREVVDESTEMDDECLNWLLLGDWQKAMTRFNSPPTDQAGSSTAEDGENPAVPDEHPK